MRFELAFERHRKLKPTGSHRDKLVQYSEATCLAYTNNRSQSEGRHQITCKCLSCRRATKTAEAFMPPSIPETLRQRYTVAQHHSDSEAIIPVINTSKCAQLTTHKAKPQFEDFCARGDDVARHRIDCHCRVCQKITALVTNYVKTAKETPSDVPPEAPHSNSMVSSLYKNNYQHHHQITPSDLSKTTIEYDAVPSSAVPISTAKTMSIDVNSKSTMEAEARTSLAAAIRSTIFVPRPRLLSQPLTQDALPSKAPSINNSLASTTHHLQKYSSYSYSPLVQASIIKSTSSPLPVASPTEIPIATHSPNTTAIASDARAIMPILISDVEPTSLPGPSPSRKSSFRRGEEQAFDCNCIICCDAPSGSAKRAQRLAMLQSANVESESSSDEEPILIFTPSLEPPIFRHIDNTSHSIWIYSLILIALFGCAVLYGFGRL